MPYPDITACFASLAHKQKTFVKMCGFTTLAQIDAAARAGVDAIGLIFYPASGRYVHCAQAAALAVHAKKLGLWVFAVWVNADEETITHMQKIVPWDILQFHGDESPEFCMHIAKKLAQPYVRAIAMNALVDVDDVCAMHPQAAAFLLDAPVVQSLNKAAIYGGSGHTFDWQSIPMQRWQNMPLLILSGGITQAHIPRIQAMGVRAIDLSSGIESWYYDAFHRMHNIKGEKSPVLIEGFMRTWQIQ